MHGHVLEAAGPTSLPSIPLSIEVITVVTYYSFQRVKRKELYSSQFPKMWRHSNSYCQNLNVNHS